MSNKKDSKRLKHLTCGKIVTIKGELTLRILCKECGQRFPADGFVGAPKKKKKDK